MRTWVDRVVPNPQPLRPNILFILTDDQRWDSTDGTHGIGGADVMPRTRAELVDSGIEFKNGFMTTPLCCPSRASILTGSYAHRTGVYKNGGNNGGADDFEDASTLATWLQGAGYRTSLIGKYLNGYPQLWTQPAPPYVPPGWTEWRGVRRVSHFDPSWSSPTASAATSRTRTQRGEDTSATCCARRPRRSSRIRSRRGSRSSSTSPSRRRTCRRSRRRGTRGCSRASRPGGRRATTRPTSPTSRQWVQALALQNSAQLDQIRIDQLEMLQAVDEAIGGNPAFGIVGIMEHLRNLGVADDTIVVYFADNGWYWGEHRLRAKNNPYEEAIRSPMFVRYPKLAPLSARRTSFALNIDLAPTFAELAGVGVPIRTTARACCASSTARRRAGGLISSPRPGRATIPGRSFARRSGSTPRSRSPGESGDAFETELYDLVTTPTS